MTFSLFRKTRHLVEDPVLRQWLLRKIMGLEKATAPLEARLPPYLPIRHSAVNTHIIKETPWLSKTAGNKIDKPKEGVTVKLPGASIDLAADAPGAIFTNTYFDLETMLAAHRFAWVPLAGPDIDFEWVAAIWKYWINKYAETPKGWPWHPYTAAERAINIIDYAEKNGIPGNPMKTHKAMCLHGEVIRENLEYNGENYTSNHLSNNGRGLLKIGVALDIQEFADDGAQILVAEAQRIFGRSGVLKEGSSHYHLLATRNYIDAWITAERGGLKEAPILKKIAENASAVVPRLCLPGGMPLIGDISPDAPPGYFAALTSAQTGPKVWPAILHEDDKAAITALINNIDSTSPDQLSKDGWHRFGNDDWHALAYIPPDGWPPMPGHGHQDLSNFELHDGETQLLVDPGRGSYADSLYANATVHNCITMDGYGPSPINRPYYDDTFRRRIVSHPPVFEKTRSGRILQSHGFSRFAGVGSFMREWRFTRQRLTILDQIEGRGNRRIERHYFTTADVELEKRGAMLYANGRRWRISAEHRPRIKPAPRWIAYGIAIPGNIISFGRMEKLPFKGVTVLERL